MERKFRNRAAQWLGTARREVSDRVASLRGTARTSVASLRSGAQGQVSRVQLQMRSNPIRWAGIAAGAGFGIGILARMIRHRAAKASLPRLAVIDSTR